MPCAATSSVPPGPVVVGTGTRKREDGERGPQKYQNAPAVSQEDNSSEEGETRSDEKEAQRERRDEGWNIRDDDIGSKRQAESEVQSGEGQVPSRREMRVAEKDSGAAPGQVTNWRDEGERAVPSQGESLERAEEVETDEKTPEAHGEGRKGGSGVASGKEKARRAAEEGEHSGEDGDEESAGEKSHGRGQENDALSLMTDGQDTPRYETGKEDVEGDETDMKESEAGAEGAPRVKDDGERIDAAGTGARGAREGGAGQATEGTVADGEEEAADERGGQARNGIRRRTVGDSAAAGEEESRVQQAARQHEERERKVSQTKRRGEEEESSKTATNPALQERLKESNERSHHGRSRHHPAKLWSPVEMAGANRAPRHASPNIFSSPSAAELFDQATQTEKQKDSPVQEAPLRKLTEATGGPTDPDDKGSPQSPVQKEEIEGRKVAGESPNRPSTTEAKESSTLSGGSLPSSISADSPPGFSHVEEKTSNLLLLAWQACKLFTCGDGR